jgi:hypothetical protein
MRVGLYGMEEEIGTNINQNKMKKQPDHLYCIPFLSTE